MFLKMGVLTMPNQKDSSSPIFFDYSTDQVQTKYFNLPLKPTRTKNTHHETADSVVVYEENQHQNEDGAKLTLLGSFQTKLTEYNSVKICFHDQSRKNQKKQAQKDYCIDQHDDVCVCGEDAYLIVRKQKNRRNEYLGYKMGPGQILKLGKSQLFVKQMRIQDKLISQHQSNSDRIDNHLFKYQRQQCEANTRRTCKICLCDDEQQDNLLFNPCKCSGSCKFVHIQCLSQWMNTKVKKESVGGYIHYNFQNFHCEVCRSELPLQVEQQNGKTIKMIAIDKPLGNYIMLEGSCKKKKCVIIIQDSCKKGIMMGRTQDCEIQLSGLSVSRNHAFIRFTHNQFYIFDNLSKFGTLVKPKKLQLEPNDNLKQGVQIRGTIFLFEIKKEKVKAVSYMKIQEEPKDYNCGRWAKKSI